MSAGRAEGAPLRFADFTPGAYLGEARVVLDRERFARWRALFPTAAQVQEAPPGLLVALFMNGFAEAFAPHPDGNIHAGQTLAFTGRSLRAGEGARVSVVCREAEIKRGRNRVRFEARMCDDAGGEIMSGEMLVIWAV
ncbi:MAG: hypothetical protein HLUCCO17_13750 [Saliniramus fredricksonii]|uniref:Uncharacterized protein n=1 Tax=Saliniramus fredricksonii TaxID=1653334 RepID=A0A0P7Y014_9HYPH|nr:hypothetical protein [Saliniramus fredricksonii]KPQ09702.1 MAG: hypothetical protein HLUCCO17_13750 [Saliniramus fredricksonii]SCC79841.1 hypothetical protein GA0071312_1196 [Saliniramus fredricksonii]